MVITKSHSKFVVLIVVVGISLYFIISHINALVCKKKLEFFEQFAENASSVTMQRVLNGKPAGKPFYSKDPNIMIGFIRGLKSHCTRITPDVTRPPLYTSIDYESNNGYLHFYYFDDCINYSYSIVGQGPGDGVIFLDREGYRNTYWCLEFRLRSLEQKSEEENGHP